MRVCPFLAGCRGSNSCRFDRETKVPSTEINLQTNNKIELAEANNLTAF